jgi:hypothetical protein
LLQEVPRQWLNQHWNFDHLGNALITLFIMATLDSYAGERGQGKQCDCVVGSGSSRAECLPAS